MKLHFDDWTAGLLDCFEPSSLRRAAAVRTSSSLLEFLQPLPILRLRLSGDCSDPIIPGVFLIQQIRLRYTLDLCGGVPFGEPEAPPLPGFYLDCCYFDNRPPLRATEFPRKPKLERNPYFLVGRVDPFCQRTRSEGVLFPEKGKSRFQILIRLVRLSPRCKGKGDQRQYATGFLGRVIA
jgi:hypothetical protein